MNQHAFEHIPESKYSFAVSSHDLRIRLRVDKNDPLEEVSIVYGQKYEFYLKRKKLPMERKFVTGLFAYYETTLHLEDVRLVYIFSFKENGKEYFYSEDGVTPTYDFATSFYNCFQYSYINENDLFPVVPWMQEATFYQIFVDRFYRGDHKKDDRYINSPWGKRPTPKSFSGGDLKGITEKLSYLKDLGFSALYLTPIFSSISNHKYDTNDYYEIDPMFGDEEALHELVSKAHEKKMRIVLDAVFNHCSDKMKQFQDVLEKGEASPYYDWFIIKDIKKGVYETFASCDYMPKLNTANKEVQKFLIDIALHYIKEFDIDGWRLDVSDEVSHDFWRAFRKAVKEAKPDAVILGENWHDAHSFLLGEQFDGIMNYAFTKATLDAFATKRLNANGYAEKLSEILMRNNDHVNAMMLNLLDTHDTHRFLTEVKGDKRKLYSALATLYFYLGAPCVYYGTEIDLEGGYDPDSRRDYDWEYKDHETRDLIQSLAFIKKKYIHGFDIEISAESNLFTIKRTSGSHQLVLTVNLEEISLPCASKNLLLSHGYHDGQLDGFGFAIQLTEADK